MMTDSFRYGWTQGSNSCFGALLWRSIEVWMVFVCQFDCGEINILFSRESCSFQRTDACTHIHTYTHTRARAYTHTRTHTQYSHRHKYQSSQKRGKVHANNTLFQPVAELCITPHHYRKRPWWRWAQRGDRTRTRKMRRTTRPMTMDDRSVPCVASTPLSYP